METVRRIMVPPTSLLGPGALKEMGEELISHGFKKALVVSDKVLVELGLVKKVTDILDEHGVEFGIYNHVVPNPTMENVHSGLKCLQELNADVIISLGGGSPQDAAKAIGILATNGGHIKDYEGIHVSKKKSLPIIAINTTAGTASEATINYVITNEETQIKMVMVDKNCLATVAISDPELMLAKPAPLTAATGMDALTHAVEAYVSIGAFRWSDTLALEAIKMIGESLKDAVEDGNNLEARSKMAWGSYIAGLAFNNCGLGYVHSMAHQLGGFYNLPHGVCNAVLLPHVERFNADACGDKLRDVAEALGKTTEGMSREEANEAALAAIEELSAAVGIPSGLKELGVQEKDIELMAANALEDVCKGCNPKEIGLQETIEIYMQAM